jgi:hypothetical protein
LKEADVDIRVQVTIEHEQIEQVETIAIFQRDELQPETLGITLAEAQDLLTNLQSLVVSQQVAEYHQQQRPCPDCGLERSKKDSKRIIYRTAFGKLKLDSPRFYTCDCHDRPQSSESPLAQLLSERTSPELLYLQTKWASLLSYGMTTDLLNDVLPIDICTSSVRHKVQQVAQRAEDEMLPEQAMFIDSCPAEWSQLPDPVGRLTVGIDGGYIHARDGDDRKAGCFEAIVGKSIPDVGESKCFGFVTVYDAKPKRRLHDLLQAQGLQLNQDITFLSDGGDTVRDLQLYLSPQAEHVLDWFHITMRITVMRQMAKGLPQVVEDWLIAEDADRYLESIKWYLWHGNVYMALSRLDLLHGQLECFADDHPRWNKLYRTVEEFMTYIQRNQLFIPNYGERHFYGEKISTGFVESAVNQIISKRFVKKQQMRWTKRGAHLLLQMRTKVLNEDLISVFRRWYPNMDMGRDAVNMAA